MTERPPQIVEQILQPLRGLLDFMKSLDQARLTGVFAAEGVIIIDSFAPHVFDGAGAVEAWADKFTESMEKRAVRDLAGEAGEPQLLTQAQGLAYCSVPVTWRGSSKQRRFSELGVFALVLTGSGADWRIRNLSWAGVSYVKQEARRSDSPP